MIITFEKMHGSELERIFRVSKMSVDAFAERLGIKRTKLYAEFKKAAVDLEVSRALVQDPELSGKRQLLAVNERQSEQLFEQKPAYGPSVELLAKSMDMINETLIMVKDSLRIISDDNRFIKEDADIYRKIVQSGLDQGAIKFVGSGKKGG